MEPKLKVIKYDPLRNPLEPIEVVLGGGLNVIEFDFPLDGPGGEASYAELLLARKILLSLNCAPDFGTLKWRSSIQVFGGVIPAFMPGTRNLVIAHGLGQGVVFLDSFVLDIR
jgi:hypothetical protein